MFLKIGDRLINAPRIDAIWIPEGEDASAVIYAGSVANTFDEGKTRAIRWLLSEMQAGGFSDSLMTINGIFDVMLGYENSLRYGWVEDGNGAMVRVPKQTEEAQA